MWNYQEPFWAPLFSISIPYQRGYSSDFCSAYITTCDLYQLCEVDENFDRHFDDSFVSNRQNGFQSAFVSPLQAERLKRIGFY